MLRLMFTFFILAKISFCVEGNYFIDIIPQGGDKPYAIKSAETITFTVAAYKKTKSNDDKAALTGKVWWQYDKKLFKKISQTKESISLKAINTGRGQIQANTLIKNKLCEKKIDVFIK